MQWVLYYHFYSLVKRYKGYYILDLRGAIPTFIRITEGKGHDVHFLDELVGEAGAFYVMNRGYLDYARR